jgi:probable HAF family extracellular repeat protein
MSYRFTTVDNPNALAGAGGGTQLFGISNKAGVIAGGYFGSNTNQAGFADFLGNCTAVPAPPGASSYVALDANNSANFVGGFADAAGYHGFLDINGTITVLNDPKASGLTIATGINDSGKIVGYYYDANNQTARAFTYSGGANGTFADLNVPGAGPLSAASGINVAGDIVGYYRDASQVSHGFLDHNGVVTTIDVPFANGTALSSINDSGEIVGR